MADWVNKGSYQDLSGQVLKPDDPVSVMAPTSQQAGNQVWANNAMTAPGGASGDLGKDPGAPVVSDAPVIDDIASVKPGEDGKPQARTDSTPAPSPGWAATSKPSVVRQK
jgi:hypothetical protein